MSLGKRPQNLEQLIFKDVNEKVASATKKLEKFQQKIATEGFFEKNDTSALEYFISNIAF